jgi:hypothetical protein
MQTVNENDLVALTATARDPEAQGLTYTWTQIAGPNVAITNHTAANASFTAPEGLANTQLVFQVAVSDGVNTTIDTVVIDVNRDNDAPSVDAGASATATEFAPVQLVATAHDPEAVGLTYAWRQTGGPTVALLDGTTSSPRFEAPGVLHTTVLTFEVAVSDGVHTSYDTVQVVVEPVNEAPYDIVISETLVPSTVQVGTVVAVVSAQDADIPVGDVLRFEIVGDAGPFAIDPNTGELRVVDMGRIDPFGATPYTITVRVLDSTGGSVERELVLRQDPFASPPQSDSGADELPMEPADDLVRTQREAPDQRGIDDVDDSGTARTFEPTLLEPAAAAVVEVGVVAGPSQIDLVPESPMPVEVTATTSEPASIASLASLSFQEEKFERAFEEIVDAARRDVEHLAAEATKAVEAAPQPEQQEASGSWWWALLWGAVRGRAGTDDDPTAREREADRQRQRGGSYR